MLKQPEVDKHGQRARLQLLRQRPERRRSPSCTLKPWDERKGAEQSAAALAGRAIGALSGIRDAFIFAAQPAADPRARQLHRLHLPPAGPRRPRPRRAARRAQPAARHGRRRARCSRGVRPEGLEDAPQLQLDIDRDKASALGVSFADINATLSTAFGSTYVNDFPNAGPRCSA